MGLGDLKSQLLKAGVVSEKQARKAAHQKRKERSEKGHEALEAEQEERRQRLVEEEERRREADREREQQRRHADEQREQALRLAQIASGAEIDPEGRPTKRWYFEARDGRLPYLQVDDHLVRRLESGRAALVESPAGEAWIVAREAAERIGSVDRAWIRCWNRR